MFQNSFIDGEGTRIKKFQRKGKLGRSGSDGGILKKSAPLNRKEHAKPKNKIKKSARRNRAEAICKSVFMAGGSGVFQRFARLIVAEGRNTFFAQRTDAEIEGHAQPVHPNRLREREGCEHEPIARVRASAQNEHEGYRKRIHQNGENSADDEF